MAANPNTIARRRALEVFVVAETTKGTLVFPAAGQYIIPVGYPDFNQIPTYTNSEEIENTRDIMDRFQDRLGPGNWSISVYSRPSGSAGTAPMEKELLKALFGIETISGGTSVTYSQAIEKPSVSIWIKYDHTVRFCAGATVSSMSISPSTKGGLRFNFSGQFMTSGIVGTQDLAVAITATDTSCTVDDASCYSVGGKIEVYDVSADTVDDNSGAGYAISAVDRDTNVITISDVGGFDSAADIDDIVRPFLPTGTVVGNPMPNRKAAVSINSVSADVTKFDINVNDPCVYIEDEITASGNVEEYVEDLRGISGTVEGLFKKNDAKYLVDNLDEGSEVPLELVFNNGAGSIITINIAKCSLEVPSTVDSAPTVRFNMPFTGLGNSTGEDSMTIVFT